MSCEYLSGRSVVETLHDLSLQLPFEDAYTRTRNLRNVTPFPNVPPYDLVTVLVCTFLVRSSGIAEENTDTEFLLESFVMEKENIVVERERFQLREPFPDTTDRTFHGPDGYRVYLLKERCTALAVGDVENDP